jgi:acyl carrier protein
MAAFGKHNYTMDYQEFEAQVREVLELEDDIQLDRDQKLEETDYWSSMHSLLIMSMAESEFGVSISGEDLRETGTLGSLYELLISRQA